MISTGACFAIALTALIAGIIIGGLAREHYDDIDRPTGDPNWADLNRAATAAYYGAHGESVDTPWADASGLAEAVMASQRGQHVIASEVFDHARMDEAAAEIGQARRLTLEEAAEALWKAR